MDDTSLADSPDIQGSCGGLMGISGIEQHRFRDREREAVDKGDTVAADELDLFRKDVGTFLRQYDFLSQLFDYEDPDLEKLSIYLRYLAPVIRRENVQHAIDLSGVDFEYLRQNQQATSSATLAGGCAAAAGGRRWWQRYRA
ncbi:hypothetical protein GDN83_08495 [Gordonia jinghuaiqii]|uniref:Uncharacterized protein n=1 Tax=Gordonia jinghuaiqii TaxID=2758710 RepID=A0A7D7LXT5_9ACTN|nr:hypothetical protein [Gordonia jinghuaiqii]MCR5977778.1 hypothetical protein [Gordonia jinghuaiqii]QMT02438.1 hypothetical protein H1R19_04570 [Gordonia jinghuaiqii]